MADTHPAQALDVIKRVERMCDFLKNPIITQAIENGVPVTMPRLPGALGFDVDVNQKRAPTEAGLVIS